MPSDLPGWSDAHRKQDEVISFPQVPSCAHGMLRPMLADTEEVYNHQIQADHQLHRRISMLEIALAQSHAKHSIGAHPLLATPYIFSSKDKRPPAEVNQDIPVTSDDVESQSNVACGTLVIGVHGEARFMGSSAGSEYLREAEMGGGDMEEYGGVIESPDEVSVTFNTGPNAGRDCRSKQLQTSPSVFKLRSGVSLQLNPIPFCGVEPSLDIGKLREHLPDWDLEGRSLVEIYWENVDWMWVYLDTA